jgi:hypothetical protein
MTWRITDGRIGCPAITDTTLGILQADATYDPPIPVGTIVQAVDETYGVGEFIYLKGLAATAVGSWVGYFPVTGATILAVAGGNYPLAIAMSANLAGYYGWYQISGVAKALGLTSITHSSGFLAATSTPGSVDDASVIGDAIFGARKTTTVHVVGTFLDTYAINRPFMPQVVTVRS